MKLNQSVGHFSEIRSIPNNALLRAISTWSISLRRIQVSRLATALSLVGLLLLSIGTQGTLAQGCLWGLPTAINPPQRATFGGPGGTGSFGIFYESCPEEQFGSAAPEDSWLHITSVNQTGTRVDYRVDALDRLGTRTGHIKVITNLGTQLRFEVFQERVPAPCPIEQYSIEPDARFDTSREGGQKAFTVRTTYNYCAWGLSVTNQGAIDLELRNPNDNTLMYPINGAFPSFVGTASFITKVGANQYAQPGAATILVSAGNKSIPILVTQPPACSYSATINNQSFGVPGGTGSISVSTNAGDCPWSASTSTGWITLNSGQTGTGNGIVGFTVSANTGVQRTGLVCAAHSCYIIRQEGKPCYFSVKVDPSSLSFTKDGGSRSATVTTSDPACQWSVDGAPEWISFAIISGQGTQTFSCNVLANKTTTSRTATVKIAGTPFIFTQQPGDPLPDANDIVMVQKSGGMSGMTELSALSALSTYNGFSAKDLPTGFLYTGDDWTFQLADWNRDGHLDLIGIHKNGTPSGKTEVHILSGASGFTDYILHIATPLEPTFDNWDFIVADWDRDGHPDLIGIKKQGTHSGTTEIHILSGASQFTQFVLHTKTALSLTDSNYAFAMADWDRDGHLDLFMIKKAGTGTGTTEVHVLSGKSNFSQFILHTGTALHQTDGNWEFILADWNRDGRPDLIGIAKKATGSGATEVHILSGARSFGQFILHTRTALGEVGKEYQFVTVGKIK